MADTSDTWEAAYDATDTHLAAIAGLVHAAFLLPIEHPHLNTNEPESVALDTVLQTLREKNEALSVTRSAAYRAGLALSREQSNANERGN
jgi:hypothetical protein